MGTRTRQQHCPVSERDISSPPSSMLGQFLVVVTFTNLQPPTQARQKRPGSREETVFAVRHEQLFNNPTNERPSVYRTCGGACNAAHGTDRGRGSSRRSDEGLVPFAALLSQPWFPICKTTHWKHSTDTWRLGSGAVHLFDGLSSSPPSDSRHHSLPPTMELPLSHRPP